MDDDDYHYNQERKAQRWRVIFGIGGALCAVALLVMRYGNWRDREAAMREPMPAYFEPPIPGPRTDFSAAKEPVEFVLAAGDKTFDVVSGQRIELPGGAIALEQTPIWSTAAAGYHFQHRSAVSISPADTMMIASIDGVVAKIQVMDATEPDAALKKVLSSVIVDSGQAVGTPQPVKRTIAGAPRDGTLHDTTTPMKVEVFLVPVGSLKLGVLLYRQDPNADTSKIDGLLESIAAGAGAPLPAFTAPVAGNVVELFLDKPVTLALTPPVTVTLQRRPTVLRTVTGNGSALTFEYPRGLAVSRMPNDQMLAVSVQTDTTALQLFDLGMRLTVDELRRGLVGQVATKDLGDVTHTVAGMTLAGKKLRMQMANMQVDYELFVFDRGGKTIGAGIQYLPADEKRAVEMALPILASLR